MINENIILALIPILGGILTLLVKQWADRRSQKKDSKVLKDGLFGLQTVVMDIKADISILKNDRVLDIKLPNLIQRVKDFHIKIFEAYSYKHGNRYESIISKWCEYIKEFCNYYYFSDYRQKANEIRTDNLTEAAKRELERQLRNMFDEIELNFEKYVQLNLAEIRKNGSKEIHFIDLIKISKIKGKNQAFINRLVKNGFNTDTFLQEIETYLNEFFEIIKNDIKAFREGKVLTEDDVY